MLNDSNFYWNVCYDLTQGQAAYLYSRPVSRFWTNEMFRSRQGDIERNMLK
jgi:hypothetical protein